MQKPGNFHISQVLYSNEKEKNGSLKQFKANDCIEGEDILSTDFSSLINKFESYGKLEAILINPPWDKWKGKGQPSAAKLKEKYMDNFKKLNLTSAIILNESAAR